MGKVKINNKKAIGDVIFILEGKDDEFRLLTNIFEKIFSITTIRCRSVKTDLREYLLPDNRDSVVFLINSKSSSINAVDEQEYIQEIFEKINIYFKIDISNSAIYFIWDRDKASNNAEKIRKLFAKYYNSRDNGYEMQGLLLLSYPSIESFMISCFENEQINCKLENIKQYITNNKYYFKKIDEEKIINAAEVFLNRFKYIIKKDFSIEELDLKMQENNNKIFDFEEEYFIFNKFYYYFSCVLISLFDLGLLEIVD